MYVFLPPFLLRCISIILPSLSSSRKPSTIRLNHQATYNKAGGGGVQGWLPRAQDLSSLCSTQITVITFCQGIESWLLKPE